MQKKQVLLKHALRREIRSAHEARLVRGGQPEQAYILTMTMILRYESGDTAVFPRHVTYKYRSASDVLTDAINDDAAETALTKIGEADFYSTS